MKTIEFFKMVATGNDFVVVDGIAQASKLKAIGLPGLARMLCLRKMGIGADGLLVLEKSKNADFKMRIFNPDGSEPEMCGNGARCIALFAREKKIAGPRMSIQTIAGTLKAEVKKNMVKINMADPFDIKPGLDITVKNKDIGLHYINTGVPHAVCFVKDLEKADVFNLGRSIRYHEAFKPKGANVDFLLNKGKNAISIRTYERGVEAETLACGTGATASAIISSIISGFTPPIKVYTKGGLLIVHFKREKDKIKDVYLEGEARFVYKGEVQTKEVRDV